MATTATEIEEVLGVSNGKVRWKKLAGGAALLAILGGAGMVAVKKWQSSAEPAVRYTTQEARIGNLTTTVTATGKLYPMGEEVDVGSEVSGIIDSVEADYNDHVKVGQVLARINTERYEAAVLQSKAALAAARAKVQDAQVTVTETEAAYKRTKDARERSKGQSPSQHDLDTALAAYERAKVAVTSAQASVTQAEATLSSDQTNLSKTVIKSPVDGMILARKVSSGQTIAAQFAVTTMFVLAKDLRQMELHVNIDEADVGQVKEGQKAAFTVDAFPGHSFPGRITQLRYNATTTSGVVTYEAIISVDNREMLLRPGMTATAAITVYSVEHALLVPNLALRFTPPAQSASAPGEQRSWLRKLMPGPPPMSTRPADPESTDNSPKVYVLRNAEPSPVAVKTGATNGKLTEILSGGIASGVPLVIDLVRTGQ
jgi:HlyD family secretion protein